MTPLQTYLASIERELQQGKSTEHTHRPALKTLIETLYPNTLATNEPKRIKCGAPDYIITKGQIPLGHIEAKDIGTSLVRIESDSEKVHPTTQEGDQLRRYREGLPNLILTDYLEFRWYIKGKQELTGSLATLKDKKKLILDKDGSEQVKRILQSFMQAQTPTVSTPRELASRMAAIAKLIRMTIELVFEDKVEDRGLLQSQLEGFKQVLLPDLTPTVFADMYAQTICYGLFAARCNHTSGAFTRREAVYDIPETNPFLRKMFNYIAGIELDERINWTVDSLAELLNRADIGVILQDFGKRTLQEDPIVHFYETFLAEYDSDLKDKRGVFYTPEAVVSYIVRSVDHLLKTVFDLTDGLADASMIQGKTADGKVVMETHRVQILDPATGTATFLHSVIELIHKSFAGNEGTWSSYVSRHLLPRIFGFELLMAPYAVAHMKLGLQLKDTGYNFKNNERLRIYLTNTLEESYEHGHILLAEWLVEEATAADYVKQDVPVMVVLGNPPYSVASANNRDWINKLLHGLETNGQKEFIRASGNYFEVDGKPLGEQNPKALYNDYVKFIRFAQWRIERTGYGILAYISDNSYLDGAIHRGMRQSLMHTFDDIYLLDLHGNSNKREKTALGTADENVFEISEGVSIGLFIKHVPQSQDTQKRQPSVYHAELLGKRDEKYHFLTKQDIATTGWQEIHPHSPLYLFVPYNTELGPEYEQYWAINKIFSVFSTGVKTHRNHFVVDLNAQQLRKKIEDFRNLLISDAQIAERYHLGNTRDWNLEARRRSLAKNPLWEQAFTQYLYHPFDIRAYYHHEDVVELPRNEVMRHLLNHKNVAIITTRLTKDMWSAFCSKTICDHKSVAAYDTNYLFPLYLYPDTLEKDLWSESEKLASLPKGRQPNVSASFIETLTAKLGLNWVADGSGDLVTTIGPDDFYFYMYAVFQAPSYRRRYTDLLKRDFPRLPLTSNADLFRELCKLGSKLVGLHLMEEYGQLIPKYPVAGNNVVEKVDYTQPTDKAEQSRVWINKTQYFDGVPPEVWEFHIGGYQVCQIWLKDHKGRALSFEDIKHYQRIVGALQETIELMDDIDETIEMGGGWPIE